MPVKPREQMRDLVVVGTSAGGLEALRVIARGLPPDLPAAVLVVMHLGARSPYALPHVLRSEGPLPVGDVVDGAPIERSMIYVAPPDHHLLVDGERIRLSRGPRENRTRPAVDPLFRSAALHYGPRVIAVVLTGGLDDGTAGLVAVRERGGVAVVQDPREAQHPSMPQSALREAGADFKVRLDEIPGLLIRLVNESPRTPKSLPASRVLEVESRFDTGEPVALEELDAIGSRAALSCPECDGPLWKVSGTTVKRFRCHVGHAYTVETMLAAQREAEEMHLWQALRIMRERASVLFEAKARAEDRAPGEWQHVHSAEIRQLQENIAIVQTLLRQEPAAGDDPGHAPS